MHAKYEVSISTDSKVMANVKVGHKQMCKKDHAGGTTYTTDNAHKCRVGKGRKEEGWHMLSLI